MDTFLAITSRRDLRPYAPGEVASETVRRILDAGRLSGSARNRQPWRFIVVEDPVRRDRLAGAVHAPENVRTAALVVAIASSGKGPVGFDCGRAAQSMLLAAWNDGVASSPNGIADPDRASALLGLAEDEQLQIVLSFGLPRRRPDPESRTPDTWSAAADRRPLDDVVTRL